MPPPGRIYEHVYQRTFEDNKRALGLNGKPFEHFWRDIEKTLDDDPSNIYVRELPGSEGFRIYPTMPEHPDFLECVIYFSVDEETRQILYWGIEPLLNNWP